MAASIHPICRGAIERPKGPEPASAAQQDAGKIRDAVISSYIIPTSQGGAGRKSENRYIFCHYTTIQARKSMLYYN
jgi:hypothetical protein